MDKKLIILIIVSFGFLGFTVVNNCSLSQNFKIDSELLKIKDSIGENDTLILYRYWVHTNGENGYGKAVLKSNGQSMVKTFEIDSKKVLKSTNWSPEIEINQIFREVNVCIAKPDTKLYEPHMQISHDGEHIVEVYANKQRIFDYCINDQWIKANMNNNNIQLVSHLKDTLPSTLIMDGLPVFTTRQSGKNEPKFNPTKNETGIQRTDEIQIYLYAQKRFLKKTINYKWEQNKWVEIE